MANVGSRLTFACPAIFYGNCRSLVGVGWTGGAMHIVELQYSDAATAKIVAAMRNWRNSGNGQPTIRYSLLGAATVLHVDFEFESEARAFAQAFGGTVLR